MKIKMKYVPYEYVKGIEPPKRKRLKKPSRLFKLLVRVLSIFELCSTKFTYTQEGMEKIGKEPCLILMNHSSFIDLKIASKVFFNRPYHIVSTMDGFVGKCWLMRQIGCIPTRKFVSDVALMRDIHRALRETKTSVLLFPEAGYSLDGKTTVLPKNLGGFIKKLGVPIVSVITDGAFLHQPLYNNLRMRKNRVTAHVQCLLTKEEAAEMSAAQIDERLDELFSFDNFKAQYENGVKITDPHRAEGLHRILYRCPACQAEGKMLGEGVTLTCQDCGKVYTMDEYGRMHAKNGETEFPHIPDWTEWERECVRKEIESGEYRMNLDVDIGILADYKALYMVGNGTLLHDENGFTLTGCDGELTYQQSPLSSYSLNSDFFWYEIGDVIGIGDTKRLYYCFPKQENVVTKARFAAEELHKIVKARLANK